MEAIPTAMTLMTRFIPDELRQRENVIVY